jgi:hypothetical protein
MKDNVMLTISSMITIVLTTFHITGDMMFGYEKDLAPLLRIVVPVMVVLLYGTLVLAGRRSGYVIIVLGSLLGLYATYLHAKGAGVGRIINSPGAFFFIWGLIALAVTSAFSIILAAQGLWRLQRTKSP